VTAEPGVGFERAPRTSPLHWPSRLHLSARRAGASALALRAWRSGDVIETHAGATLKVQDLFTDQKVPRSARFSIPILVAGDRVVAVPGGWIARGWQVEHETAPCLRVTFAPAEGDT
jgi:tRNA(Ile)-lysidine synthetase-like protein